MELTLDRSAMSLEAANREVYLRPARHSGVLRPLVIPVKTGIQESTVCPSPRPSPRERGEGENLLSAPLPAPLPASGAREKITNHQSRITNHRL